MQPPMLNALCMPPQQDYISEDHELEVNYATTIDNAPLIQMMNAPVTHVQSYPGADWHLVNNMALLSDYEAIKPFNIGAINGNTPIQVIGKGTLTIPTTNGAPETPIAYYSPNATGTLCNLRLLFKTGRVETITATKVGCACTNIYVSRYGS